MNNRLACVIVLASVVVLPFQAVEAKKKAPPKTVTIDQVVTLVTNSLAKACKDNPDCATLTSVDLTLHTELDQDYHLGIVSLECILKDIAKAIHTTNFPSISSHHRISRRL